MAQRLPLAEIARMYYEDNQTQEAIAREFGTSRSTISRVLKRARDLGIVRFTIVDPNSVCSQVATKLRKKLNLQRVVVVEGDPDSDDLTRRDLGTKSAELLVRLIQNNQTIGTCWGSTIYEVVRLLTPKPVNGVQVVQFVGTVGGLLAHTHADQLARMIAQAFNGEWHVLPAPAVVQNGDSLQTFLDEPQIKRVLELGKRSDIALVGIGVCDGNALLAQAGYITKSEMQQLRSLGAVGEIGCRFYDANGNQCRSDVDDRTISIPLSDLRQIPIKIGIAAGLNKVPAIKGALAGGYVNILVTDLITARALLDECDIPDGDELC